MKNWNPFSRLLGRKNEGAERRLEIEQLEPRILFSGTPGPDPSAQQEDNQHDATEQVAPASNPLPEVQSAAQAEAVVSQTAVEANSAQITQELVEQLGAIAAQRWADAGLSAEQIAALGQITYQVADLGGNHLGAAQGYSITIDDNAGGSGWFVDSTPLQDEEFSGQGTRLSSGMSQMDLLTTLMHEQGHILGLLDNYQDSSNLMYGFIANGERRLAANDLADGAQAGSVTDLSYLTAGAVWTGGAGNGLMSDAGNWANGVVPIAGDDLVFTGAGAGNITNDLPANTRFNSIVISGSGYNFSGNAIELSGGLTASHTSGTVNFDLDVTLINAQTVMNANAGAVLNFTGDINTGNLVGTSQLLTGTTSALTFDGAGSTNMSGVISGAGSISKIGDGTVALSGNNSYEGITDVRQGVLVAAHNNALGSATTGETQVQSGASLHVRGNVTISEALAIREGGVGFGDGTNPATIGALRSVGGTNVWAGHIELATTNNTIGVDNGSTLNISGVVSGSLGSTNRLIKTGEGTLQLTGTEDNLYRGETRVLQGTLELGKTPGKNAIGGSLIVGDDIEASGTKTVRLLANNQLPMTDYFDIALNTITVSSTGVLDFNGFSDTIGNLALVNGVTDSADVLLGGGTLTLGGASVTVTGFQGSGPTSPAATIQGGTLDLGTFYSGAGGGFTKTFAINNTALASTDQDLIVSAHITGTADVSLTKTGAGVMTFSGNNTYAGPTFLTNGIVRVGSDTAFGTGLVSIQGTGLVLRATGGDRIISNDISIDGNFGIRGASALTFTGDVTLTGSRTITIVEPTQVTTFSGVIGEGDFGNQSLTKAGRGTLVLTAANTYSGSTTIALDGGTIRLSGNGSLLSNATITVNEGGVLELDNRTGANLSNRVHDDTGITLSGGEIAFIGATGAAST